MSRKSKQKPRNPSRKTQNPNKKKNKNSGLDFRDFCLNFLDFCLDIPYFLFGFSRFVKKSTKQSFCLDFLGFFAYPRNLNKKYGNPDKKE
jgi:hypothetical protein